MQGPCERSGIERGVGLGGIKRTERGIVRERTKEGKSLTTGTGRKGELEENRVVVE